MFIIIFLILLFIIQIVMLKETIKDNTYNNWSQLLTTIEVSILIPPLIVAYVFLTKNLEWDWDFLPMFIVGAISFILSIIMLIVSTIKKSTMKNTMKKDDKSNTKSIVIAIIVILALFLVAIMTDYIPRRNEYNNINDNTKSKESIIKLLNEKYSYGDFKIVGSEELKTGFPCLDCDSFGYQYTLSTKYFEDTFEASLSKDGTRFIEDDFLDTYYKRNGDIISIENEIPTRAIKQLNEELSKNFNATISFDNEDVNVDYLNYKFGYIPSLDELTRFAELKDAKIEIKDDLKTDEELLNYLIKLTKFYINDLDTSNIIGTKYFRFTNNSNKGYVHEEGDSTINICINSKITNYKLEDILK